MTNYNDKAIGGFTEWLSNKLGGAQKRAQQFHESQATHRMNIDGQKELMTHMQTVAGAHETHLAELKRLNVEHFAGVARDKDLTQLSVSEGGDVDMRTRAAKPVTPVSEKIEKAAKVAATVADVATTVAGGPIGGAAKAVAKKGVAKAGAKSTSRAAATKAANAKTTMTAASAKPNPAKVTGAKVSNAPVQGTKPVAKKAAK